MIPTPLRGCARNTAAHLQTCLALAIIATALVACGKKSTNSNRLVLVNFSDPKTFNPITAAETSSRDIIYMLFTGLTTKDQVTQEVQPALAESWSVEPD